MLVPTLPAPVLALIGHLNTFWGEGILTLVGWFLVAWSLIWKGLALWVAVRRRQRGWFIALLILNTIGILEIIYIFLVEPKHKTGKAE